MNRTGITAKIQEIAERVAQPEGIEIVEIELKGAGRHQILMIIIDRPPEIDKAAGVTHGDCEFISHQVGAILDAEDLIPGTYQLEVSSPGVERKLRNWKDWVRFVGEKARIVLREPVARAGTALKSFEGVIARADDHEQTVTVELADGGEVTFPVAHVDRANLKFEW